MLARLVLALRDDAAVLVLHEIALLEAARGAHGRAVKDLGLRAHDALRASTLWLDTLYGLLHSLGLHHSICKMDTLQKAAKYSLSDDDIQKLLGKDTRILRYPELANKTIENLFDRRGNAVLLFLTEGQNSGHWIGALYFPKSHEVEVFDSFGTTIDGDRRWISHDKLLSFDEAAPLLSQLLSNFHGKVIHNTTKLQKDSSDTCGRHVCMRMLHRDLSLPQYIAKVQESGQTPDDFVTEQTFKILGK